MLIMLAWTCSSAYLLLLVSYDTYYIIYIYWKFQIFQVKVLYVRNLKADVTEAELKEKFEPFGTVERVKKVKGYGFIHFTERDSALKAMQELNKTVGYLHHFIVITLLFCKNLNI